MNENIISLETRKTVLNQEVVKYVRKGYRVIAQTDTTAQLIKPKKFSWLLFLILVITAIGWLLYLIYYWVKRDKAIFIEVDEFGKIKRHH